MTRWRRGFDRWGRYVKWSERVGKGRVLTLMFSVNRGRKDESIIMPHLIVHRPFMRRLTWRYEGLPTGVSGFDTWVRVSEVWDEGITAALALTDKPYVEVQVDAESDRLFHIYRSRLAHRGYAYNSDTHGEYMFKLVRKPVALWDKVV